MSCVCLPYNTEQLVAAVKTGLDLVQVRIVDWIQIHAPGLQVYLAWLPTAFVVLFAIHRFSEWLDPHDPSTPICGPIPWIVQTEKRVDDWLKRKFEITEPTLWDEWESFVEFKYDTYEEETRVLRLRWEDHRRKVDKYVQQQQRDEIKAKTRAQDVGRHLAAIDLMGQLSMTPLYTSIRPANREALQVVPSEPIKVRKERDERAVSIATEKNAVKEVSSDRLGDRRRASEQTMVEEEQQQVEQKEASQLVVDKNEQEMDRIELLEIHLKQVLDRQNQPESQQATPYTQDIAPVPQRPLRLSEAQVLTRFHGAQAQGCDQAKTTPARPIRQSSTVSEDRTLVNSTRSSSLVPSTVASPGSVTPAVHDNEIDVEKVIAQAVHEVALLKSLDDARPISWSELSKGSPDKTRTRSFIGLKREPKVEKLWEPKTIDFYCKQVHRSIKDTDLQEQHRLVYRAASRRDSELKVVAEEPIKPMLLPFANRPAPTPVQRPKSQIDTIPLRRVSARDGRANVNDLRQASYQSFVVPVSTYKKLAIASPGRCNEERRRIVDRSWTGGPVEQSVIDSVPSCYGHVGKQVVGSKNTSRTHSMGARHEYSWTKVADKKYERKSSVGSVKSWLSTVRSSKTGEALLGWVGKGPEEDYTPMLSPESISSPIRGGQWGSKSPSGNSTPGSTSLDGRITSYMAIERVEKAERKANDVKRRQRLERIKERAVVISEILEKRRVERERVRRVKEMTGMAFIESLFVKG